jgi:UDP-glucose 4-epimerase
MSGIALVTGGAGFIGSHLVDALRNQGRRVRVLDNLSTGTLANLRHCLEEIEFVDGDVCDLDVCHRACREVETLFHQAALPSVPRSIADPLRTHTVNVNGALHMLLAAREAGVRRFILASSSSIYGHAAAAPKHEGMPPCPLSPYAVSKLAGEQYCHVFHSLYGLETVALRYFNVFGPRQTPNSPYAAVIPKFVAAALNGQPITLHGDGDQSRDFTYVANVVQANLLAAQVPGVGGRLFNVGCGRSYTLNDLCRGIAEAVGRPLQVVQAPEREGDVRYSMADISAARAALGYAPKTLFQEGLAQTVAWARQELLSANLLNDTALATAH